MAQRRFIIIGAGPAGLTAGYELARLGHKPLLLEKGQQVGGLARTETHHGFSFDLGGHRFFTKNPQINALWHEVLADDFLRRPRLSRIYYRHRFFYYPLRPLDALIGLGPIEAGRILLSYLRWQLRPYPQESTFEQWVTNRFGRRLFLTFFKTYTEKVWGIPCSELKAEWAAQRIKDLSVRTLLWSMFFRSRRTIKTLIEQFDYPRLGPGMMWRAFQDRIERQGGQVLLNAEVSRIHRQGQRIAAVSVQCSSDSTQVIEGTDFISSMPLREFIDKLDPPPPPAVLEAASQLKYRDFLTICLIIDRAEVFPDNWIYIHDPQVQVGRIQNFKNWSPAMVPDLTKTSLGLEYFCNEGDTLWTSSDAQLIDLAKREIEMIGLARSGEVIDACVRRVPKSYPVYDADYRRHLEVVRTFMDGLQNCKTIGRNGLHRYNNQDHSMLTGLGAVTGLLAGSSPDLWSINADQEYHEETSDSLSKKIASGLKNGRAEKNGSC